MKAVSEKELVLALAGIHGLKKLNVHAQAYTAEAIEKALTPRKSKKMLDLGWYVDQLLALYEDPAEKNKVAILNCLRELMFLGAIQDKNVLAKITLATAPAVKSLSDPFVTKLKYRKVS
jgi:hypothetical protein